MVSPAALLSGPRGRRFLLEFAQLSEIAVSSPDHESWTLFHAVRDAAYQLEPGRGTSVVRLNSHDEEAPVADVSPEAVANILLSIPLLDATDENIRQVLVNVVSSARYWQEPEGEDYLTADPEMRRALTRVAEHIAVSPLVHWWQTSVDLNDQWSAQFSLPNEGFLERPPREDLQQWRQAEIESEANAVHNRPADPTANWSGRWWSIPPITYQHSLRRLPDGTPAALMFAEDAGGFDRAMTRELLPPAGSRIYEIDGSKAWTELCRRYPLEQTAQKRQDWYRTTGRVGRWVIPDWSVVAQDYDAIHLSVIGYLSAAGTAIPVDDETASVIAGWNPDETWWLGAELNVGETKHWGFRNTFMGNYWEPEEQAEG